MDQRATRDFLTKNMSSNTESIVSMERIANTLNLSSPGLNNWRIMACVAPSGSSNAERDCTHAAQIETRIDMKITERNSWREKSLLPFCASVSIKGRLGQKRFSVNVKPAREHARGEAQFLQATGEINRVGQPVSYPLCQDWNKELKIED